jgi:hypothetical protein
MNSDEATRRAEGLQLPTATATPRDWATAYLASGQLPIPGRPSNKGKSPLFSHKPRNKALIWSRDICKAQLSQFTSSYVGLLLDRNLFVVDFDTHEEFQKWSAEFRDVFEATVLCKTRKGFHVWFLRSQLTDTLAMTDGPCGFKPGPDGKRAVKLPIDIKTRTGVASDVILADGSIQKYYTPGFLSVPPSPNKVWVRSPFTHTIAVVPDAVVLKLKSLRDSCSSTAGASVPRAPASRCESASKRSLPAITGAAGGGSAEQPQRKFWRANPELFRHDLAHMAKTSWDKFFDTREYEEINDLMLSRGYMTSIFWFKLPIGTACFLCGKPNGHKNSFWVGVKADGSRRVSNYNPACIPSAHDVQTKLAITIPFTRFGMTNVHRKFAEHCTVRPTAEFVAYVAGELRHVAPAAFDTGFFFETSRLVLRQPHEDNVYLYAVIYFGLPHLRKGVPVCHLTHMPWVAEEPPKEAFLCTLPPKTFYDELQRVSNWRFSNESMFQAAFRAHLLADEAAAALAS